MEGRVHTIEDKGLAVGVEVQDVAAIADGAGAGKGVLCPPIGVQEVEVVGIGL